jgi:hypothetical protein
MMNLKSLRKFNMDFRPVLKNTSVLYAIALISCLDIMYMFQINKFNAIVVFILAAFVTSFFSKNMMVILFFALVLSHIYRFGANVSEGMENKGDDEENKEGKEEGEVSSTKSSNGSKNIDDVVDDMINNMSDEEKKEIVNKKDEITQDFAEVSKLQETMVNNVKSLEPLLNRAEKFMNKYGKYAKISEKYL